MVVVWFRSASAPSWVAAGCLVVVGIVGLRQPLHSSQGRTFAGRPDLLMVDGALQQRELTLQQRRDAEALLEQFIRGQMTRHYWGHFAASLRDLGLDSGPQLEATVTSTPAGSELWLRPRRGKEGYAAAVHQGSSRILRWQCRGPLPEKGVRLSLADGCPDGWTQIGSPSS